MARDQFRTGLAAANAGQWDAAREAFARAYALYPRPLTLLDLAGAQAYTNRLVDAAENYRRFLREATAPPASDHRDEARKTLERIEARIPHVRIVAEGLGSTDVVLIDGTTLPSAALGLPFPVDPGSHEVTIERGGAAVDRTAFQIDEGATQDVTLHPPKEQTSQLEAAEPTPRPTSPLLSPAPPEIPKRDAGPKLLASPWFWTVAGVVVAGSAVTAGVLLAHQSAPAGYSGNVTPGQMVTP